MHRDRNGELVEDVDQGDGHRCRRGWINREDARPCRVCRPWLVQRPARPPTREELDALRERLATAS